MKRQSQLHLHLTEEEKRAIEHEAQRRGMTISAWGRDIIRPKLGMLVAGEAATG
jgi:hypothetical protein